MKLHCFKVKCVDSQMNEYTVGVLTVDENAAKQTAVCSFLQSRNLKVKAIEVFPTDRI